MTVEDVVAARSRIAGGVFETACIQSIPLSELFDAQIFCKLEYMQRTGSFKERGARNALLTLSPEQRIRGAISASAGNHALGMSYHGRLLKIPVTVVMPTFAPLIKVANCRKIRRNGRSSRQGSRRGAHAGRRAGRRAGPDLCPRLRRRRDHRRPGHDRPRNSRTGSGCGRNRRIDRRRRIDRGTR